jgi:adenylate kinase family enzyme
MNAAMKRVMIVGGPGSGKSTLAEKLGAKTGLPVFYMDHIHWNPGWVERTKDEKNTLTREIHAKDAWIFEGNHSSTFHERVARADTLIWLDLALWLRVIRVLRRTVIYLGRSRPDLPENCNERLGMQTIEFLQFIWRTRQSGRAKVQRILDSAPSHLAIHHLKTPIDVQRFLVGIGQKGGTARP